MEDKLEIINALLDANVNYVGITYSGGGDSGAIDEKYLFRTLPEDIIQSGEIEYDFTDREDIEVIDDKEIEPQILIRVEDLFFPHLNNIEDWWNNEGGYGSAVLDLNRMMLQINNNTYYTETHKHDHSIEL